MSKFNELAPVPVKKAIVVLWGLLALILMRGILDIWFVPNEITVVGDITLRVANLLIGLFAVGATIVFMRMRINWARYLLAAFFALGLPSVIKILGSDFQSQKFLGLLDLLQLAAEGYTLYLIFLSRSAKEWFEP
jgi:hypothetical protein